MPGELEILLFHSAYDRWIGPGNKEYSHKLIAQVLYHNQPKKSSFHFADGLATRRFDPKNMVGKIPAAAKSKKRRMRCFYFSLSMPNFFFEKYPAQTACSCFDLDIFSRIS